MTDRKLTVEDVEAMMERARQAGPGWYPQVLLVSAKRLEEFRALAWPGLHVEAYENDKEAEAQGA